MSNSPMIRSYFVTLAAFLVIDGIWLAVMVPGFYSLEIGFLMRGTMIWPAAVLFYLLYALGLTLLAVRPGISEGSLWGAVWRGGLLGAAAYGTYNLTNYATLEGWPLLVTVVDQVWGTLLGAAVASVGWWGSRRSAPGGHVVPPQA